MPGGDFGASAGAFVASIVGTRTDAEYLQLFENNYLARALTANRGNIKIGFQRRQRQSRHEGTKREMARMIPDMTFLEAYEKTGRSINITISPAEPRQNSRLLEPYQFTYRHHPPGGPGQSALPGVFSPVQPEARNVHGKVQPTCRRVAG